MRKTIISTLFMAMSFSITSFAMGNQREQIVDFVYERDAKDASKIIYDDWTWLLPHYDANYGTEYRNKILSEVLWEKNRSGKLNIKVLRNKKHVIGLISFYRENSCDGQIRIVSVAQNFRNRGCGRKLIIAAINELFDSGCTRTYLFTHKKNEKMSTYKSLGFKETEMFHDNILWFKEAEVPVDDYVKCVVTKETFKPYEQAA